MPSRAAADLSLTQDVPPTDEMHGDFPMYGKSFSVMAPMQTVLDQSGRVEE